MAALSGHVRFAVYERVWYFQRSHRFDIDIVR